MLDFNDKAEIQNMIEQHAVDTQYGVNRVAYHAHTGVDSSSIDGSSIVNLVPPRITTITNNTAPIPDSASTDLFEVTALTATATFGPPAGNPVNGQLLRLRITSSNSATARGLAFSAASGGYLANSPAFPAATTTGKTTCLGFEYDMSNSVNKWRLIWSANS